MVISDNLLKPCSGVYVTAIVTPAGSPPMIVD